MTLYSRSRFELVYSPSFRCPKWLSDWGGIIPIIRLDWKLKDFSAPLFPPAIRALKIKEPKEWQYRNHVSDHAQAKQKKKLNLKHLTPIALNVWKYGVNS